MPSSYLTIQAGQLVLAALLMLINLTLTLVLKLGLAKVLAIAMTRMLVQLLLIGYVLEWLFNQESPVLVVAIALVMTSIAGLSAVNRTRRRYAGIYWNSILSVLAGASIVTGLVVGGVLRVDPWYDPQYLIPILGMVLGNSLNGISLGLDRFTENLMTHRHQIESDLSLGATHWEAAHNHVKAAIRTGMVPMINSMMVMGLVSLPGMMTGQILAGANPLDAVRYQIVILFTISSGTALATLGIVLLGFRVLFSGNHQLKLDQLILVSK